MSVYCAVSVGNMRRCEEVKREVICARRHVTGEYVEQISQFTH